MSEAASQEESQIDSHKGYFPMPRELRATLAQAHKNTAQFVEFLAEQTFGWHARWVYLTYDEIRNGRKKATGERMGPGSLLSQDKMVRRAITDALEQGLIEIRSVSGKTAYAIHKRFWRSSQLTPLWAFFKIISYSPDDDPLDDEEQTTVKKTDDERQEQEETSATTVKKTAAHYHIDSKLLSNSQQPTVKKTDEMSDEVRPQEARREPINTSPNTSSLNNKIDTSSASLKNGEDEKDGPPPPLDANEVDTLAQRVAEQHVLRQLLAEQERLQSVRPSQAGWGEAQRRLRSLAREIARLQAALVTQEATAPDSAAPATFSGQAERAEERRSPGGAPPIRRIHD